MPNRVPRSVAFLCLAAWLPSLALADFAPLMAARQPLFATGKGAGTTGASLFAGRAEHGLFAPWPEARDTPLPGPLSVDGSRAAARLRDLIADAEAGPDGYDAVQWGARIRPPAPPTSLTLARIDDWIRDTPGQPHAIGRYQFIPKTLRWLVARLDLPPETQFTPAVQDRLADLLLADAGLDAVLQGDIDRVTFMHNLARIWAGFPLPDGRSFYEGVAGNKATMSWQAFEEQVGRILS